MPNRLTRDAIIHESLNLTDSPTLDQKERPDGVNLTGTLNVFWLQRYVDLFHEKFPLSCGLACATITFSAGVSDYAFPLDYIQVYRNGMYLTSTGNPQRLRQASLDKAIHYAATFPLRTGAPGRFVVMGNGVFRVFPTPDKAYTAEIWYYSMPAPLGGADIPPFPSDHILVDTLHLRQREWLQMVPAGTALQFAHNAIAELQKAGISNEPEPDEIDLDPDVFPGGQSGGHADWMGPGVGR